MAELQTKIENTMANKRQESVPVSIMYILKQLARGC